MKKEHLYFKNPQEGVVVFKQKSRYNPNSSEMEEENIEIEKDYTPKTEDFILSLRSFNKKRKDRAVRKTIAVPEVIELITVTFHDIFDSSKFENIYRSTFGLDIIAYFDWNTKAIFAISNYQRFDNFIKQLEVFINTDDHNNPEYDLNVKFIKDFDFLSRDLIIDCKTFKNHLIINLIDSLELDSIKNKIENRLIKYLDENHIEFKNNVELNIIEVIKVDEETIIEIVDNFDVIQSVNSYSSGFVRPNIYNLTEKSYGFEIINSDVNLPIIGIIDTGIENKSPLNTIIINDASYNLTNTSSFIDNVDHGTAVATIAALGDKLYPNHLGNFEADAKLLSIKTLDNNSGQIFESEVIELIRKAKLEYNVQIFTLTIGYNDCKKYNERISSYAFALDKLSHELNILVFISISNVRESQYFLDSITNKSLFPLHFLSEDTNLCSPAESMNNLTVGAFASNLEDNEIDRITPLGLVPAIYSRTFHINWDVKIFKDIKGNINHKRTNKLLFKPDVISHGGDYDNWMDINKTGLKVLTTERGSFFSKEIGTSYSAPFVANLAARILKKYPELSKNIQTIKALIINSSETDERNPEIESIKNSIIGNGFPNEEFAINSSTDKITFILEDEIEPETIKSFSLKLPNYLLGLMNSQSILEFTSTLCFSFLPLNKSQFTYCPIHMAFGFFDNIPLEDYKRDRNGKILKTLNGLPAQSLGINYNKMENIKLKNSWSQDYYYKPKVLSNSQKVKFRLTLKFLKKNIDTDGNIKVKIAINSKLHKLLDSIEKERLLNVPVKFSLVTTIEELPYKNKTSNRLYEEMQLINSLDVINDLDLEAENY
ncbi:S8 family peptidase [Flavobacterium sp. FlaQc-48]|uniref:S8 family peptidase n=1 Tax=Flavobacterium sp. FlaQc-48 TaxID=3374181 RepID=UPI003757F5B0